MLRLTKSWFLAAAGIAEDTELMIALGGCPGVLLLLVGLDSHPGYFIQIQMKEMDDELAIFKVLRYTFIIGPPLSSHDNISPQGCSLGAREISILGCET